jgi:hypothetical protein
LIPFIILVIVEGSLYKTWRNNTVHVSYPYRQ